MINADDLRLVLEVLKYEYFLNKAWTENGR